MKRLILFPFTLFSILPQCITAQDLTGIWRGFFIDNDGEQYRYEVQIDHQRNILTGVTYSYLDKRFYGKATFTGNFNKSQSYALVQEIRTVEVRMSSSSYSCIQKCLLTYTRSGKEEFLEGTFTSMVEKTDSARGIYRGENCGDGKMYLRKVPTSDFYIEPFLRNKTARIPRQDVVKPPVAGSKPGNTGPVTKNNTEISKPKNDPEVKIELPEPKKEIPQTSLVKPSVDIPAILKSRENNLVQTLFISSENVTVNLYDNGEIDDDTISVYLDNKLILSKQRLTAAAITVNLKMDEENPDHELVMVAENLGRIPPNTSLMVVLAGEKRYEVRITSTEQKNAMVRFKYVKPKNH